MKADAQISRIAYGTCEARISRHTRTQPPYNRGRGRYQSLGF